MKDDKELFNSLLFSAGKSLFGKDTAKVELSRFLIGILAFAGAEALTVAFRKNFRKDSINIFAFTLAVLCFAAISALSFWRMSESNSDVEYFRGALYALLALYITWQGRVKIKGINNESLSPDGESQLLNFLRKDNVSPATIQYFYEPLLAIALGTSYSFFDIWGGLPLITCGVSLWIKLLLRNALINNRIQKSINENSEERNPSDNLVRPTAK